VIVEPLDHRGEDARPEPTFDLGSVEFDDAQPECEEVVGDAIVATARARAGLGDGHDPLDEPQLDQPLERAGRLGAHGLLEVSIRPA